MVRACWRGGWLANCLTRHLHPLACHPLSQFSREILAPSAQFGAVDLNESESEQKQGSRTSAQFCGGIYQHWSELRKHPYGPRMPIELKVVDKIDWLMASAHTEVP